MHRYRLEPFGASHRVFDVYNETYSQPYTKSEAWQLWRWLMDRDSDYRWNWH